ncbi:Sh3 domain-containing protein, partial [Globisporangium splendens]
MAAFGRLKKLRATISWHYSTPEMLRGGHPHDKWVVTQKPDGVSEARGNPAKAPIIPQQLDSLNKAVKRECQRKMGSTMSCSNCVPVLNIIAGITGVNNDCEKQQQQQKRENLAKGQTPKRREMMHHEPTPAPVAFPPAASASAAASMPLPTTVRWIPDAEVSLCFGCKLLFDWVRRKHHCRLIREDQILSNPERQYLSVNGHNPQRVCDECYNALLPVQVELRETMSNAVQHNDIDEAGPKRFLNSPYSFTLREEIRKAAYSVKNFMYQGVIKDQSIPLPLITQAQGIAFLTVIKVGFVFTGRVGTGLVVARLPDGRWSAPSAIATAGVGWGAQIGGEITDFVIILNTKRAVDAFCSKGQVNLGAELGVCAGPVGRVASGGMEASSDLAVAPCYSYSHSKGLFVGISLEGSMILSRPDVNRAFYGRDVQVTELLRGMEPPPVAASPLYESIHLAMSSPANGLNRQSSRASESNPHPAAPVSGNVFSNAPVKL